MGEEEDKVCSPAWLAEVCCSFYPQPPPLSASQQTELQERFPTNPSHPGRFPTNQLLGATHLFFTCSHTLTLSGSDTPVLHTLPDTLSSVIHHTTLGPKQYSTYSSSTNTTPVVTPPFPRIKHPPMVLNRCTVNTLKHS